MRPYLPEPFLSYTVLNGPAQSCLVFWYTVWYYTVFTVLYCCIMVFFSLVLYGRARSCIVFFGCIWSIRSCQVLYDIIENYTVLEGPVCSSRFLLSHTLSSVWSCMVLNYISVLLVVFLHVLAKSWSILIYSNEWSILVLEGYLCFFIDRYRLALSKLQIQGLDQIETLNTFDHHNPHLAFARILGLVGG